MNLKDAFRLQKFFSNTITTLNYYISTEGFATKVVEIHEKNLANKDVANEEINLKNEKPFECSIETLVFIIIDLMTEKAKLSYAIESEKKYSSVNWTIDGKLISIDIAIEYNSKTRELLGVLKHLNDLKSNVSKKNGRDFKFNINGEQVSYNYNINVHSQIDFDRNIIKNLYKKYLEEADNISNMIERYMINSSVDFQSVYSYNDSIDDIIEKYSSKGNSQE